jgi:hypothetical protein
VDRTPNIELQDADKEVKAKDQAGDKVPNLMEKAKDQAGDEVPNLMEKSNDIVQQEIDVTNQTTGFWNAEGSPITEVGNVDLSAEGGNVSDNNHHEGDSLKVLANKNFKDDCSGAPIAGVDNVHELTRGRPMQEEHHEIEGANGSTETSANEHENVG